MFSIIRFKSIKGCSAFNIPGLLDVWGMSGKSIWEFRIGDRWVEYSIFGVKGDTFVWLSWRLHPAPKTSEAGTFLWEMGQFRDK